RRRKFRSGTRGCGTPVARIASGIIRRTRPIHWSKHTLSQTRLQTREGVSREESGLEIGIGRRARRAYGFDEIALVPGGVTLNPDEVDISFSLANVRPARARAVETFALALPFWG